MRDYSKLNQERHRLALRFGISESDIELELVPLMLAVEQSVNKIDQATAKVNDSIKPVVYNNHYNSNTSAWRMFWGNISTGIGQNVVSVSLIFSAFIFCSVAAFILKDAIADQEKIELTDKRWNFITRQFIRDRQGNYFIPKENYVIMPDKKGIRLINKEE
ncbi:hypothetical protein [Dyadobacter sp. BHUBP1]|uniref:hypothetical protein n=1 Tax=Dyadobacter sp. BHUBP1 TaxID=3424178 RepID=UPI003D336323